MLQAKLVLIIKAVKEDSNRKFQNTRRSPKTQDILRSQDNSQTTSHKYLKGQLNRNIQTSPWAIRRTMTTTEIMRALRAPNRPTTKVKTGNTCKSKLSPITPLFHLRIIRIKLNKGNKGRISGSQIGKQQFLIFKTMIKLDQEYPEVTHISTRRIDQVPRKDKMSTLPAEEALKRR